MVSQGKKSYYKSKRRIYVHDKEHDAWYFTIVSDIQQKKYCYAEPTYLFKEMGCPMINGMTTHKLCKPGAKMMLYDNYLQLLEMVKIDSESEPVKQILGTFSEAEAAMHVAFKKKCGKKIQDHNAALLTRIDSLQICGF